MILFKNTAGQTVYTRAVSLTGGAHSLVAGLTATPGLTAYIAKDGGTLTVSTNSVYEVGRGIYSLAMSQTETNCDSGVVHFVGATAWHLLDPVYFQTSSVNPVVGLTASALADIKSTVKGATYDGNITQEKLYEMMISFLSGQVAVSTAGVINTYSFKTRNGGLTSFTSYCSTVDGTRASTGLTG